MCAQRDLDKKKASPTPEQRSLYDEFLGDLAEEYVTELQGTKKGVKGKCHV